MNIKKLCIFRNSGIRHGDHKAVCINGCKKPLCSDALIPGQLFESRFGLTAVEQRVILFQTEGAGIVPKKLHQMFPILIFHRRGTADRSVQHLSACGIQNQLCLQVLIAEGYCPAAEPRAFSGICLPGRRPPEIAAYFVFLKRKSDTPR